MGLVSCHALSSRRRGTPSHPDAGVLQGEPDAEHGCLVVGVADDLQSGGDVAGLGAGRHRQGGMPVADVEGHRHEIRQ